MTFETIKLALDEAIMNGDIITYNYTSVANQDVFYITDTDGNQRTHTVGE